MSENVQESFNNLLDTIINQENKLKNPGNVPELFKFLMINTFFKKEVFDNKSFSFFLEKLDFPSELNLINSLKDVDMDILNSIIKGDSIDKSFAGGIMLSKTYMKNFHPNHPNEISKVPIEIRTEMRKSVVEKNKAIIAAFEKMKKDIDADKKRKIITLIALVLKNIKRRTGRPIKDINGGVANVIKERFPNYDEIFTASKKQMTILSDQSLVRDLLKIFFVVKSFEELKNLSDLFTKEIERFKKRAKAAFPGDG